MVVLHLKAKECFQNNIKNVGVVKYLTTPIKNNHILLTFEE